MSTIAIEQAERRTPAESASSGLSAAQFWGLIIHRALCADLPGLRALPRALRLLAGARAAQLCRAFRRSDLCSGRCATRCCFLIIGINLKMVIALFLSGILHHIAGLDPLAVGPVHRALGAALDPDDPLLPLHAQPRMGDHQPAHLPADLRGWPQLAQQSRSGADARDRGAYLEVAALLDADPDLGPARYLGRSL